MLLHKRTTPRFLTLLASSAFMAGASHAQTVAPQGDKSLAAANHQSAFDGYRAYTDDAISNWKAANDKVAQIGGWREYARQAQQPDNTPSPTNKALEITPKPLAKAKP